MSPKTLREATSSKTLVTEVNEREKKHIEVKETTSPHEPVSPEVEEALERLSLPEVDSNIVLVDWEGPHDPHNPKNWNKGSKWTATLIVSLYGFISPLASSIISPATEQVQSDFGLTNSTVAALWTSMFVLAYGFGPLVFGPLSEIYGRTMVLHGANIFFFAFNLGCGFAQNTGQLLAFRFLAGFGGACPLAVGGGVLGDVWRVEERGLAITVFSVAPLIGPVIGPITGAWIAQTVTWRWTFWSTSIAVAVIQVIGFLFLRETYAPVLLERKANHVRNTMSVEDGIEREVKVKSGGERHWKVIVKKALLRPFHLFFSEPIVQILGVYMAFIYGLFYLFLTTVDGMFRGIYKESIGIGGLHYIDLGVGITIVSIINALIMDKLYFYLEKRNGDGSGRPEFRLPPMVPGTFILPIGLFLAGWTARGNILWIVSDIGVAFVGAGAILNFQVIQTYIIDSFTLHAASALAAVMFLRSLAAFGFPLFAPAMYNALGYGKGDSILACVAIIIGCPAPWFLWYYGERLRKASKYAEAS
ncbi:MFS polyamine transporter [Abortiporus biennis]|nr:MFS polyamine transporter [Abortiporus biennis]